VSLLQPGQMDLKHASLELTANSVLIDRHRYPNPCMVASELPMPMLYSKVFEGNLATRFGKYLDNIV
jgi:hypothetical protein